MRDNDMSSCVEDAVSEFKNILRTYRITTDLNNTCTFDVGSDSPGLWETLPGQNANYRSLNYLWFTGLEVDHVLSLSRSLTSLSRLETLTMHLSVYIDLQLPPSLKYSTVCYCWDFVTLVFNAQFVT
ncbi:hypothetical protein DPMN_033609 [Dreissena polymorpha]|uniref:Uncharacterized protein n=1 Tax=Dreissena polymorpha TaxID=45954 RepID=A0A9D4M648_DREPO|nr:hypothetical protein DPMN_033609 [Dreissena polymorpha]